MVMVMCRILYIPNVVHLHTSNFLIGVGKGKGNVTW
jgi:hypothetical protein